jgi:hypothetical protein
MIYHLMDLIDNLLLKTLGIIGIRIRIRIRIRVRDGIRDGDGEWRNKILEVQKFRSHRVIKIGVIILIQYSQDR